MGCLLVILMCDGHLSGWCASIASKITIIYFPSQKVVSGIQQWAWDSDLINCNMVVAVGLRDWGRSQLALSLSLRSNLHRPIMDTV